MRRLLTALAFGLVAPALTMFGCTFLITFDDVAARDAGTPDRYVDPIDTTSSSGSSSFGSSSGGTSSSGYPFYDAQGTSSGSSGSTSGAIPPCESPPELSQVQGCDVFVFDAQACASNATLKNYPFTSTLTRDLVVCRNPSAFCVTHCTTKCAALPSGFPDECDRCADKPSGKYCGREMGGWNTKNDDLLVQCSSGAISTTTKPIDCGTGCVTTGNGTSHCQ
jgi:hypothetical protein